MGSVLPQIASEEFDRRLRAVSPEPLTETTRQRLYLHFLELRRWNPRLSLIGPGTRDDLVERHYGESLAALPLIADRPALLVDLGSGAGFPGLVLAAARPALRVTLVESRQRKWAFLHAACRAAALPCTCLNARVGPALPEAFPERVDLITARAIKLTGEQLDLVRSRLAPGAAVLLWVGRETPSTAGFSRGRTISLAGSSGRRILELRPSVADGHQTGSAPSCPC